MQVPRLDKGKGFKGPEALGCFNTGFAPAIFHSRSGKYVVGPEMCCRDAMREGLTLQNRRVHGQGGRRVYFFKGRAAAVAKFQAICAAQMEVNTIMLREHAETKAAASRGDLAATLALADY